MPMRMEPGRCHEFVDQSPRNIDAMASDMQSWIDYKLPPELIAQEPLKNRTDARLMVVDRKRGAIAHHHVRDLPRLLRPGDRLVLNDTKVICAQLRGVRIGTGGKWQGLFLGLLGREENDEVDWKLVCKTRGRLKELEPIMLVDREGRDAVKLWLIEQLDDGQWRARPESDDDPFELLERIGRVPLPPYIRGGQMVDADVENYQTVYAQCPGAVAAPTAGLHFTRELLRAMEHSGAKFSSVTLHVGMGTFRPISVDDLAEHPMHAEWAEITGATATQLEETRAAGNRIVAVGTTVVRTLESALAGHVQSTADMSGFEGGWSGETDLFIRPPYAFRAVDLLLTNFHFPRTTLLLLVQAFGGSELIREAYEEAVREEYRFYSYGDAMLIV